MPILKAKVLWTLHMVAKQRSHKSNEDMGELFQTMFPDSAVTKTFKCGRKKRKKEKRKKTLVETCINPAASTMSYFSLTETPPAEGAQCHSLS